PGARHSASPRGAAFQRVPEEEQQTAGGEPSELGVHVALPKAVDHESHAEGQHRDDLEDLAADVEHERHYNGRPDPVTTRAASLSSERRFRYDRSGRPRGAGLWRKGWSGQAGRGSRSSVAVQAGRTARSALRTPAAR